MVLPVVEFLATENLAIIKFQYISKHKSLLVFIIAL